MSGCGCHSTLGATDPNEPKKKPCGPCQQAAEAIVRATPGAGRLNGASDDLTTLQTFLTGLSNGTAPTPSELQAAQQAASNLSTVIAQPSTAPAAVPAGSSVVSNRNIVFALAGTAIGGAALTYFILRGKR